eukprot:768245-Hanusia_phi.AAC.3
MGRRKGRGRVERYKRGEGALLEELRGRGRSVSYCPRPRRFRRSHMSMVSERNVGLSRWLGLPVEKKKSKEEEKKEKKEKLRARRSSEATEFPSSYYSIDDVVNEIRRVSSRFQRLSVKCEDTKMRRSVSPASSLSDSRLLMPTMNG